MAFEWVAGLFQSEEARGLSGESASSVALDDANPYYNYRLRRHATDGDLVADPGILWYTSPYVTQRQGLGTHVAAEPGEGVANYTDVLLILSEDDHSRARQAAGEPWQAAMERALSQEFDNFCRREGLQRPHAHRGLGFKVLVDGSDEMQGFSLGLKKGEFVTGLLPNLYTGPIQGSYPVIGVHVNLPNVWEGYREVGRLHNDQILFTLGNHWLDNFCHPDLAEAALYRLQQHPDGNFVHIINPDLQDRYQVTSTVQNNASVLTLSTREGRPIAYLVLAVMEAPSTSAPPARESAPKINMPSPAPQPAQNKGFEDPIPSVAPPMLIDDEIQPVGTGPSLGGKTIIPDAPSERIFTLQERGALLQKVHFSAFMLGYDVYLGGRGELGTKVEQPAATFQVRKRSTALVAHVPDVVVAGEPAPVGEQVPLDRDCEIVLGDTKLDYRNLRTLSDITGWPYVGEIRRPASSTYLIWGEEYQIGRSRECRVVLPDQTSNDNIHWKPKVGDGAYIRARTGEIPKANFYTDSIMVSSEHATIDLTRTIPRVECKASHCYVFVRRDDQVLSLYPTAKQDHAHELNVEPGDEVLIGNCLFQVGFSPGGEAQVAPAPAPEVQFNPDSLADAVPQPSFDEMPPPPPPALPDEAEEDVDDEHTELSGEFGMFDDLISAPPPPPPPDEAEPPPPPPSDPEADIEEEQPSHPEEGADVAPDDAQPQPDPDEDETAMWAVPPQPVENQDIPAAAGLGHDGAEPEPVARESAPDSIIGNLSDFDADDEVDVPRLAESPVEFAKQIPVEPSGNTFNTELSDPEEDDDEFLDHVSTDIPDFISVVDDPAVDETQPPPPPDVSDDDSDVPPSEVPKPFPELDNASMSIPPIAHQTESSAPDISSAGAGEVVYTDDADAQFELGRPCHVILAGWMVNGEAVIGNHGGAELVLPENRIVPGQTFPPRDYAHVKIRGRKGSMRILAPTEVLIDESDPEQESYDDLESRTIDVIRRDEEGEEDFAIRLTVVQDRKLPDPRARLIALDYEDPLAAALVTRGLPLNAPRSINLAGIRLSMTWTGEHVTVSDYIDTYKDTDDSFKPFFVQRGGKRFTTAPEDGSDFQLASGDRFVIGQSVYVVLEE